MFRNYAAAAIRNLFRNRAYAAINLLGLAIGFAASLLIALYIRDEYNYNRFIPDADRIYQIGEYIHPPGTKPFRTSVTSSDIAPAMQLDFPEVDLATRLAPQQVQLGRDDKHTLSISAGWTDPDFFEMFRWKSFIGNLKTALSRPDGLVLTRHAARQLFGRDDVVGETLTLNHEHVLHVAAVIDDWPSNNTFALDILLPGVASYSALSQYDAAASHPDAIKSENVFSYVRLQSPMDVDSVRAGLRAFVDRHVTAKSNGVSVSKAYTFTLTVLSMVHFLPPSIGEMKPPADPRLIDTMTGIAIIIILLAAGNFASMMTARSARRAIEVGVRKAAGATRKQIMIQFMGECLFFSFLAMLVAMLVVTTVLPAFNGFLQRDIKFNFLTDPALAASLMGVMIAVGFVAGVYPSLILSRFRPGIVLKGIIVAPNRLNRLRNALVLFQFGVLVALLIATITIHRQVQYAIKDRLHLSGDQIYFGRAGENCKTALVDAVRALHGVETATCVSDLALSMGHVSATFLSPDGRTVDLSGAPVDAEFFNVFGIKLLSGRLISSEHGADTVLMDSIDAPVNPSVVINESAMHALGFSSATDAVGKFRRWNRIEFDRYAIKNVGPFESEIVGVVADFSVGSVRDVIKPTAYYVDPHWLNVLTIKMQGDSIPEALQQFNALWSQYDEKNPFQGTFLNQYVNNLYSDMVRQSTIFNAFTVVAVAIAGLGLLGLAIYTAERRTHEIGLRKVMGARRKDILKFLAWKFASPVLWANVIAWPCAYFVMRHWLEGFAYHVDMSLFSFVLAGLLAMAIAFATVVGHALMVARAKPVEALRYE
ncbi:MAG TPA: FtsX-like permease family protein [Steroidobacteraceae bacterium]|nr:FtsX-like permease family protein [Steroidobacteraceae bacterium]